MGDLNCVLPATCAHHLHRGIEAMALNLGAVERDRLLAYLQCLAKWNRSYNLSAVRDPLDMVYRHLLDSLALLPFLEAFIAERAPAPIQLLDVGTGAGLPGVPLAIACAITHPHVQFTLLDSKGKKTRFLFQVKTHLQLNNVNIINNRIEKFSPANKFAIVTSRAYASLSQFVEQSAALLDHQGQFWAMKGQHPEDELTQCEQRASLVAVHPLKVPALDGERHLVVLQHPQSELQSIYNDDKQA
ncbi:MAG: 16S rRNA (guanine(527)-N(7))-methyltransferase RsmG [Cellvibrionaceae bacterium]|nr:16S rRNA (guanine(527)-N(7))-methyltransferase RsmG [Cellvibrionaceae bacterium]